MKPLSRRFIAREYFLSWKKNKFFLTKSAYYFKNTLWITIFLAVLSFTISEIIFNYQLFGIDNNYKEFLDIAITSQAALVGIIIPIILIVVEQFFKSQDSFFKAFLYISNVKNIVVSSFLLVLILIFHKWVDHPTSYALSYLTLFWLLLNITFTAQLFNRGIHFFQSEKRAELIKSYLLDVVLFQEIKNNLIETVKHNIKDEELFFSGLIDEYLDKIFPRKIPKGNTEEILHDQSLITLNSLRNKNHDDFKKDIKFLCDLHVSLIERCGIYGAPKENYATLSKQPFWGLEKFYEWHNQYRKIIEESVSDIENDTSFFQTCCHNFINRIYYGICEIAPTKITNSHIRWMSFPHYSLINFIKSKFNYDNQKNDLELHPRLATQYEEALLNYITALEYLNQAIVQGIKNNQNNESRFYELFLHMQQLIQSLSRSYFSNDLVGAEWLLDTYLRCADDIHRLDSNQSHSFNNPYIFDNYSNIIKPNNIENIDNAKIAVIFMNLWVENLITLIGFLIRYSPNDINNSQKAEIIKNAYKQILNDNSSRMGHYPSIENPKNLLYSFIRVMSDNEYENQLIHELERNSDVVTNDKKVSGRVYVSSRSYNLYKTYAILGLLAEVTKNRNINIDSYYIEEAKLFILENGIRLNNFLMTQNSFVESINSISENELIILSDKIAEVKISAFQARACKKALKLRAIALYSLIKKEYDDYLFSKKIKKDALKKLNAHADKLIFNDIEKSFPILFFNNIEYTNPTCSQFKQWNISSIVGKEDLLDLDPKLKNQDLEFIERFCPHVQKQFLENIYKRSLVKYEYSVLGPKDPEEFWSYLKKSIDTLKNEDLTPIIIMNKHWLSFFENWKRADIDHSDSNRPEDFDFYINKDYQLKFNDNYKGHILETPIFRGTDNRLKNFLIIPLESMSKVEIDKYADNKILTLKYLPFSDNPNAGNLYYMWSNEVSIKSDLPSYELKLNFLPEY